MAYPDLPLELQEAPLLAALNFVATNHTVGTSLEQRIAAEQERRRVEQICYYSRQWLRERAWERVPQKPLDFTSHLFQPHVVSEHYESLLGRKYPRFYVRGKLRAICTANLVCKWIVLYAYIRNLITCDPQQGAKFHLDTVLAELAGRPVNTVQPLSPEGCRVIVENHLYQEVIELTPEQQAEITFATHRLDIGLEVICKRYTGPKLEELQQIDPGLVIFRQGLW